MIVHCTWCQRETGSAFALNAMIAADRVELLSGELEATELPSTSGKGQRVMRCAACKVVVWSHYAGAGEKVRFVRVGTLEEPGVCPPDIFIYTSTKLPWVVLPEGKPVMTEFYRRSEQWPAESLERWEQLRG